MNRTSLLLICTFLSSVCAKVINVKEKHCPHVGLQCDKDCSNIIYCLTEDRNFIHVEDCESRGETCATIDGQIQCSAVESDCPANERSFECWQSGTFPDPFHCRISYTCDSDDLNPIMKCICPPGFYWDTRYSQCSNDSGGYDDCCYSDSQPQCYEGHFDGNFGRCHPGYYYICSLMPDGEYQVYVLRCDSNMIYDPILHRCVQDKNLIGSKMFKRKNNVSFKTEAQCSLIPSTSSTEVTRTTTCIEVRRTTSKSFKDVKDSNNNKAWPTEPQTTETFWTDPDTTTTKEPPWTEPDTTTTTTTEPTTTTTTEPTTTEAGTTETTTWSTETTTICF